MRYAVGSLIFFCKPWMHSLAGQWVVRMESQLAKSLLSPEIREPIQIYILFPENNPIHSSSLSHTVHLSLVSVWICLRRHTTFHFPNNWDDLRKWIMWILACTHQEPHMTLFPLKYNQFPLSWFCDHCNIILIYYCLLKELFVRFGITTYSS